MKEREESRGGVLEGFYLEASRVRKRRTALRRLAGSLAVWFLVREHELVLRLLTPLVNCVFSICKSEWTAQGLLVSIQQHFIGPLCHLLKDFEVAEGFSAGFCFQTAATLWVAGWFFSFVQSFWGSQYKYSHQQSKLLGLQDVHTVSPMTDNSKKNDSRRGRESPMLNFCMDDASMPQQRQSASGSKKLSAETLDATRRQEERIRKEIESKRPSAYSNFLLSAVTSPGSRHRSPITSPSPSKGSRNNERLAYSSPYSSPYLVPGYRSSGQRDLSGRLHASPHLHNHCSSAFNNPYREGESMAALTATRTDYISPQLDKSNFRKSEPNSADSVAKSILSSPPRLPSSLAFSPSRGSSSANSSSRNTRHLQNPAMAVGPLSPPDNNQSYDPTPVLATERMQYLIENRDRYSSISEYRSPTHSQLLLPMSTASHGGKTRSSLRLTMARNDIVSTPIFQFFGLSDEPGSTIDFEKYISNLRITLALRLQEHLKNFEYYVNQLTHILARNTLINSEHHADAVRNILKMKKHERLDIQNVHVDSADELVRLLESFEKNRFAEAYPGELENVLQSYVVLLSLFVQPLENRIAAKKKAQSLNEKSSDAYGRERDREWQRQRRYDWRGEGEEGQERAREKVLASDVLRLCSHHSYDVRCVIDRCVQLSSDSHLGKFMWDASGITAVRNGQTRGRDFDITDSEIVMALFLHHCDSRRAELDLRHYSGSHYVVDLVAAQVDSSLPSQKQSSYSLGFVGSPSSSSSQQQHHHLHHKIATAGKTRSIDFSGISANEPYALMVMRSDVPSHFNLYLLNHHAKRRSFLDDQSRQESEEGASDLDHSTSRPLSSIKNPSPSSEFHALPSSVDVQKQLMHQQEQQSLLKYCNSFNNAGGRKHKHAVEELFVPEGRQNVFYAILFYLITCQAIVSEDRHAKSKSGGSQLEASLRDFAVEVFGSARIPGRVVLPQ